MLTRSMLSGKMADTAVVTKLIQGVEKILSDKIDALTKLLAEKDKKIDELETKVVILEEKIAFNDKRFELLERRIDDGEQYSRRTSLQINVIPYEKNETAEQCLNKVKEEVVNLGLSLEDCEYDRAHRVGYPTDRDGKLRKERPMIVKFTTFRARTSVYRNRNKKGDVRFYIDQTKRRFNLRKLAIEHVKDNPIVDFVFCDINCSLCIRFKDGQYKYFNSEEELFNLVKK